MAEVKITAGYLSYVRSEAADKLDDAFHDDDTPLGAAFRDKLKFVINNYCQMHDAAGPRTAEFVGELPYYDAGNMGMPDAVLGDIILRETHQALRELQEADAEFRESYRGGQETDDATDRSVRKDASEFNTRHNITQDKLRSYERSAAEGSVSDDEITDEFYDGVNSAERELDVAKSARDRLEPPAGESSVENVPGEPKGESQPPTEFSAEKTVTRKTKAVRPALHAQDYLGCPPSETFIRAKKWLTEHIILVASGTENDKKEDFPRIQPLMELPQALQEFGTTQPALTQIVREIREMTDKLRPPLVERMDDLLDRMRNLTRGGQSQPADIDDIKGALEDTLSFMEDALGKDKDEYGLGLNDWKSEGDEE